MSEPITRLNAALDGRYRIERQLGEGGMATVYLADDVKHRRKVAIKVLRPELAAAVGGDRFLREIETTAGLRHPHILPLYDSGNEDGTLYYVMPFVEGESLRQRLDREPQLPLEDALGIAEVVADALGYAHDRGIVHRDIKPENILLENSHAVVADFGVAHAFGEWGGTSLTRTGMIVGTPRYMSPEQANGEAVDARTDLYALACVTYEMLAGAPPFDGPTGLMVMARHAMDPVPPLRAARSGVPEAVASAIETAMAKAPSDRFPNVLAWREALRGTRTNRAASVEVSLEGEASQASETKDSTEGFWVAVLPFGHAGGDADLGDLAEGITEETVTGLSRFSYLKVLARSSTQRFADGSVDVRTAGKEIGARYVLQGSIRRAARRIRIGVHLVDATTGAHLWAESYDRSFSPAGAFDLIDDVVPRIVSTVADMNGVLAHTMSEALRARDQESLTPDEAVLRSLGYYERITAEEHAEVRAGLERAVQAVPGHPDGWAMLSMLYTEEHKHGFNTRPDPLGRALEAGRRAAAAAPSNQLAFHALAQAHFFRKEIPAFRHAAERAIALNPMDGCTIAFMGILMGYAGDWDHGCALAEQAMQLNPQHPGWYRFSSFFRAYRRGKHQDALEIALKINMPSYFYTHVALAAAYGSLGETAAARGALTELLAQKPDFAETARAELGKWMDPQLVETVLEGLRRAGLEEV